MIRCPRCEERAEADWLAANERQERDPSLMRVGGLGYIRICDWRHQPAVPNRDPQMPKHLTPIGEWIWRRWPRIEVDKFPWRLWGKPGEYLGHVGTKIRFRFWNGRPHSGYSRWYFQITIPIYGYKEPIE